MQNYRKFRIYTNILRFFPFSLFALFWFFDNLVEAPERGREFLSPFGQTIAARTIAGRVPEKSADFWGALQFVGIVVIKNNRLL